MNTRTSLFLSGGIIILVALKTYSAIEIELFIAANIQSIGIGALVLALICLKFDKAVAALANYIAIGGVAYLLLSNRDTIAQVLGGLNVF